MAIDFCNPAPDAEAASVGQANFEWVVDRFRHGDPQSDGASARRDN
jgi:hypothetical protein